MEEAKQQQQQQQQQQQHFLVVVYPIQGLINPARALAERLAASSCAVTFSTAVSAHRRMFPSLPSPDHPVHLAGISFAPYSDGFDAGFRWFVDDLAELSARAAELGPRTIGAILDSLAARGSPVTGVVYTMALPWVAGVARSRGLPAALFWVQPAAVLALYYHYNRSSDHYERLIAESSSAAAATVEFPGLPGFEIRELPSVLTNTSDETSRAILQVLRESFETLESESESESKESTTPPRTKVLVNTFEALEREALETVRGRCGIDAVAVGPLIKRGAGGDLFEAAEERRYMEWLDARAEGSVVYVSFGSLAVMKGRQMEEMRAGLRLLGRPYLWVVRRNNREEGGRAGLGWDEEELAGGVGMVVEWCEQVKVLSHRAVGCFVTHCGWNSTLEGVACGVPAVAAPQIVEQHTNAALLEKRFGTGVRAETDAEGVLLRDELRRCVDLVMRDEGIRARAEMWKQKAREAGEEGGSSDLALRRFVEDVPPPSN